MQDWCMNPFFMFWVFAFLDGTYIQMDTVQRSLIENSSTPNSVSNGNVKIYVEIFISRFVHQWCPPLLADEELC